MTETLEATEGGRLPLGVLEALVDESITLRRVQPDGRHELVGEGVLADVSFFDKDGCGRTNPWFAVGDYDCEDVDDDEECRFDPHIVFRVDDVVSIEHDSGSVVVLLSGSQGVRAADLRDPNPDEGREGAMPGRILATWEAGLFSFRLYTLKPGKMLQIESRQAGCGWEDWAKIEVTPEMRHAVRERP